MSDQTVTEIEYAAHEARACGPLCEWCETHARDNCDGSPTCRNCRDEAVR